MQKPVVKLVGENGNIFHCLGRVNRALKNAGKPDLATKVTDEVMTARSYHEALNVFSKYVEVI